MPTTTNFGWTTPADTDLVKDGAAAIRTLGNGIDTSFLDLKGGTTGQVLAKASNTDLDFVWSADATGIPATIFDAKGDIIAASAADTAARLAVGANGTVLTADSSTATGLKWAAPAANLDWTSLSAATPSGSTYTVSSLSGYNYLLIAFESISTNSSAGPEIALRFNSDTTVKYSFFGGYSTADIGNSGLSRFVVCNSLGANVASALNGYVMLWGANSTGDKFGTASLYGNFSPSDPFSGFMRYTGTSVISSISLITSAGSFDAGTLRILGAN